MLMIVNAVLPQVNGVQKLGSGESRRADRFVGGAGRRLVAAGAAQGLT